MSLTVVEHRHFEVPVVRRVRVAINWGRVKQMLKEAKIDLIVANIDQADAGHRHGGNDHTARCAAAQERERGRLRRRLRSEADDGRRKVLNYFSVTSSRRF